MTENFKIKNIILVTVLFPEDQVKISYTEDGLQRRVNLLKEVAKT
jgi:hypothetical protein